MFRGVLAFASLRNCGLRLRIASCVFVLISGTHAHLRAPDSKVKLLMRTSEAEF